MIRIVFKDTSPLPFREWDIEDGKIVRCAPDPEVSWIGVAVPVSEAELFDAPLNISVAWADGTATALHIDHAMRLPAQGHRECTATSFS